MFSYWNTNRANSLSPTCSVPGTSPSTKGVSPVSNSLEDNLLRAVYGATYNVNAGERESTDAECESKVSSSDQSCLLTSRFMLNPLPLTT